MVRVFTRELTIYITLLVVFALLIHPDLLGDPMSRVAHWIERGNFYHPFVYTFFVYLVLLLLRFFYYLTLSLFYKWKKPKH